MTVPSRRRSGRERFSRRAVSSRAVSSRAVSSRAVSGVALAVVLTACAHVIPGAGAPTAPTATMALAAPAQAPVAAQAASDAVAEATATMLQEFWRASFPAAFGREWDDIDTFAAVQTADPGTQPPPCITQVADVVNQAYYCPAADVVGWDADGLLPTLHGQFGPAGVAVVIAHEVGHAVQSRLGVDLAQQRDPQNNPTILLEARADCYAGVAIARVVEQPVANIPIGLLERDTALRALVGFRDPLGVDASDSSAHGNAFDRVSAFQDGYRNGGITRCAQMTLANREFTQRRFGSEADLARRGDLPLPQTLPLIEDDAREWFGGLEPGWRVPRIEATARCTGRAAVAQGPAAYCAANGGITVDPTTLANAHTQVGDFAVATLIASRYAVALLDATGRETTGTAAGAAATCLTGAYTGRLIDPSTGFRLSPGDLDEATQVLLLGDWVARDAVGESDPEDHGFERMARFRTGMTEGAAACLA